MSTESPDGMVSFATSPDAFAPPVSLHATPKQDAEEDKNLGLKNETEDDTEDTDDEPPIALRGNTEGPRSRRRAAMAMLAAGDDMSTKFEQEARETSPALQERGKGREQGCLFSLKKTSTWCALPREVS